MWRGSFFMSDKAYFDNELNKCSLTKLSEEYTTYTERFKQRYASQGYYFDDLARLRAGKDTTQVDYKQLAEPTFNSGNNSEARSWLMCLKAKTCHCLQRTPGCLKATQSS